MINRLLVANRGEITRRVFRTCRELGISTVAVFSDADTDARHVAEADVAVRLPGFSASETYLRGDLIVKAALAVGADAVHPGYGFLAENADFARAVLAADLSWVGPPPSAIEAMGSKIHAKHLMAAAGVPVLADLDPESASEAQLPLLVKAAAGGGGRGMRAVRRLDDLPVALESARREAAAAFGDATVFCEPLLERARHIEVQLLADRHGTIWALGERECSIQRRHQKIIEEAPSPAVDDGLRARLCEAAVRAAEAIGYVGAGTVEFLLAPDGQFFFLEMNTRLQVEHPVTECVYGVDLVRLQLEVAEGEILPVETPQPHGHAIEARLYAEDPASDYRPQGGRLRRLGVPAVDAGFATPASYGLRLDSGFGDGDEVATYYDPMLAKVIAWAPTRGQAIRRLSSALAGSAIHGVTTNRDLLVRVLRHPEFGAGRTDTAFLDRQGGALAAPLADPPAVRLSALAAALADAAANRSAARVGATVPAGFRNVPAYPQRKLFAGAGGELEVAYRRGRGGLEVEGQVGVSLVAAAPDEVVLEVDGVRYRFAVATYEPNQQGAPPVVHVDSVLGPVVLEVVPRFDEPGAHLAAGSLVAPMPGTVTAVAVQPGDRVSAGQPLLWLSAMKMEHQVLAPADGVVTEIKVAVGQQVAVGAVLAVIGGVSPGGGDE